MVDRAFKSTVLHFHSFILNIYFTKLDLGEVESYMFIGEFSKSSHFLKFTLSVFVRGVIAETGHSTSCARVTAILLGVSLATMIQGSLGVLFLGFTTVSNSQRLLVPGDGDYNGEAVLGPGSQPHSLARS